MKPDAIELTLQECEYLDMLLKKDLDAIGHIERLTKRLRNATPNVPTGVSGALLMLREKTTINAALTDKIRTAIGN